MKKFVFMVVLLLLYTYNDVKAQMKVDEIQTSAQCEMCKERIETNLAFEKGIKEVRLDPETKKLSVTYKSSKTDINTIKNFIAELGYDADETEANSEAYKNLPMCCKKPKDRANVLHH